MHRNPEREKCKALPFGTHRNFKGWPDWVTVKDKINIVGGLFRGNVQKKNSIFVDIVQIEVDLPPSYPIFDKFIFDKVLIMLTSLPPLEFLTKIMKF